MANPLLSIVVPTKNRYFYLKYLIELVCGLNSDEVELVIQDNSDDNAEFLCYLDTNNYSFIKYSYVKGQIPMSDNSDKAILNSHGKYVCFLGDDDGFTKGILDGVKWMDANGVEAVKPTDSLCYYWPDAPSGYSAELVYKPFSGSVIFKDPYKELIKVLNEGVLNRGNMPLVYHAIVRRDILDKVYEKCGTYFPGNSPDISNAVALSLVVKEFAVVDLPWAFSGNSAYKGGGVFAKGNSAPQISEIPWFRPNAIERWYCKLPKVAAGTVIWADSALESLMHMGHEELIPRFDLYKSYASFIYQYPDKKSEILNLNPCRFRLLYSYIILFLVLLKGAFVKRTIHRFSPSNNSVAVKNITNIIEAVKFLNNHSASIIE